MTRLLRTAAAAAALLLAIPAPASAWGSKGHRLVNAVAVRALPASVPAFLRTENATVEIELLGPEPDRLKGSGHVWDAEHDPGHYIDIDDDGTVGGIKLDALPATREAFDTTQRAAKSDQYRQGYLPYSLADGWEELRREFALWRSDGADAAQRAVDEGTIVRTIGLWGHFVADASQPLHVTVHFNGWGTYANPAGYSTDPHLHARFESDFVDRFVSRSDVASKLSSPVACGAGALLSDAQVLQMMETYLSASAATVPQLYQIEQRHGFETGSPEAVAFADARLAFGASRMRDFIICAWENSAAERIGNE